MSRYRELKRDPVIPLPSGSELQGDCGRIMIVLLTDGRANVSLAKSNKDPDALAEDAPKPTTVPAPAPLPPHTHPSGLLAALRSPLLSHGSLVRISRAALPHISST